MNKKVKSQKAETLIETLVSLLICVLSVLLLSGAVTAASKMNAGAREREKAYLAALAGAETFSAQIGEGEDAVTEVVFTFSDGTTEEVPVHLYGSIDEQIISYKKSGE